MVLWIVLALMTGFAVLAVLWPLSRRHATPAPQAADVEVYKDQLAEIDRDSHQGLIGEAETAAARIEISRRLLNASALSQASPAKRPTTGYRKIAALAVLLGVPSFSLGLYMALGSPQIESVSSSASTQQRAIPADQASLPDLVAQVEAYLQTNPDDGRAWEVVAPVYLRSGKAAEAERAYAQALRLLGSTAAREADYGEAAVMLAKGTVSAEARAAFARALTLDAKQSKARYYVGLASEQSGDRVAALEAWTALLADTDANSAIAGFLRKEIARLAPQPGPTPQDVAAAAALSEGDRAAMITAMVDGLASRLQQDGNDLDGWLKLIRAYSVMGETDKAKAAVAAAKHALAARADAVAAVNDLSKSLNLGEGGS